MILGIGVDLIDQSRIAEAIDRKERFYQRILTENEQQRFETFSKPRQIEYLSGRFAAKEACSKAIGTGIGDISFHDIEISNEKNGQPKMIVKGYEGHFNLSISHTNDQAIAFVIWEK